MGRTTTTVGSREFVEVRAVLVANPGGSILRHAWADRRKLRSLPSQTFIRFVPHCRLSRAFFTPSHSF